MNEIAELERRIAYAMERIAKGLDGLDRPAVAAPAPEPVVDRQEAEALRQALEEERLVNSQLEERLHALRQKHDDQAAQAGAALNATSEKMGQLDTELAQLRATVAQLRDSNAALRAANETGVGEPHLINAAMQTELEALRATRAAEIAEVEAIKAALIPLLQPQEEAN